MLLGWPLLGVKNGREGAIKPFHFYVNSWSILEGSPDPDGLPRFPIKSMVMVGFGLLLLQGVSQAIHVIDRLRNGQRRAAGGEGRDD